MKDFESLNSLSANWFRNLGESVELKRIGVLTAFRLIGSGTNRALLGLGFQVLTAFRLIGSGTGGPRPSGSGAGLNSLSANWFRNGPVLLGRRRHLS